MKTIDSSNIINNKIYYQYIELVLLFRYLIETSDKYAEVKTIVNLNFNNMMIVFE